MYGVVQKLLDEVFEKDKVLIESPFEERTRMGVYRDTVILGITPNSIVIASEKNDKYKRKFLKRKDIEIENFKICSVYSLHSVTMIIFKRTQKQVLKLVFNETISRYFELGKIHPRKIFWKMWCQHVNEIRNGSVLWPYVKTKSKDKVPIIRRWTDKYLYLGSKRDAEDQNKPIPIPGLGRTEDIKLLYLKPEYFGCWDQAEHWVQCDEEKDAKTYAMYTYDYDMHTYNGGQTSNITYNSLISAVGIIGQF